MNTLAPPVSRVLTMVAFAASCIGLLLFLWLSFGGTTPLAPQGYRLQAEFPQAVQLGTEADVRIAGVSIGRVTSLRLDRRTGLTRATIQIAPRFAPRPADTRAILRQKSLLGETYVELSPGNPNGPMLRDDATLPRAQVAPTVQLDQILSTFDRGTRRAFEIWMQQDGIAFTGRGEDFNAALAELYPFATHTDAVLSVLRRDAAATSALLADGGQVFGALAASPAQLRALVANSNRVFATTAQRNAALAAAIRAFPGFLIATRQTIGRLNTFATATQPLVDQLRPAALALTPALREAVPLAPRLRSLLTDLGPLTAASRAGVPAIGTFLDGSVPWLARLKPYLGGIVPVLEYIESYRREIAAFFANSTATTQATALDITQKHLLHYLRISNPVNPEVLAAYPKRIDSSRANPYMAPGAYSQLLSGLPVFGSYLCSGAVPQPSIAPSIAGHLLSILQNTFFTKTPEGPPCRGGQGTFPRLQSLP